MQGITSTLDWMHAHVPSWPALLCLYTVERGKVGLHMMYGMAYWVILDLINTFVF